jgi:adenosylhomocysteine nucleosidase
MSTLVCFALKEEAAPFHKVAAQRPGVFTIIVGIGRQNAEKSVRRFLASCSPELVLTCGFAGGLNPDLKIGDVVFELPLTPSLSSSDGERVAQPGEELSAKLLAAGAKPVKFFCTDRIATTVAEKKTLREQTGADAVEMESAAIHAVCAEKNIPCATVRVVSDTADEALPLDFNALAKADKSLDFGKLAWAIARSPGKIGALMALQKKTQLAAQQLAEVLSKIL